MTRAEVLRDWRKADDLAAEMLRKGVDPKRVDAWLSTVAAFYAGQLDTREMAG